MQLRESGRSSFRAWLRDRSWAVGTLVSMVLIAYVPAMTAGFIWDDDQYVSQNVLLQTPAGLWRIWFEPHASPQYYPLVFSTFWIEHQLWGINPAGYHVVNILLHAANAVLLFRVLSVLGVPGAFFAAALFAVHPVHVESVAWITERKNVLSGLFYLLAFLAYWRFVQSGDAVAASWRERRWGAYALALVLFGGALLSKSVTCSLPAAILLVLWWKKGRLAFLDVVPVLPMFAVGVGAGLHTVLLEKHHVGAQGLDWQWSLLERCLIAGRAAWFYAGKLVWPQPLVFIYPKWQIDASAWWQWAISVSAVALVAALWLARRRIGRGPLVGVLFFGGTLFPALGFIDVYPMRFSFVADHFQYLASIGLLAVIGAAAAALASKLRVPQPGVILAAAVVLVALGGASFVRCFDYEDEETLWVATLADNPACWMANFNLAATRFEQQRYEDAVVLFQRAQRHEPGDEPSDDEQAALHHTLGDSLLALGQSDAAAEQFRKAADFYRRLTDAQAPHNTQPHNNLGILQGKLQHFEEAIVHFQRAIEIDPADPRVNLNLGELYFRLKRFDESAACFRQVLQVEPQNTRAHYNLGVLALSTGDRPAAIKHLQEAVRIQPGFAPAQMVLRQALKQ